MSKCKDGYIYFPPQNKCVPKMGTIHAPNEQKKIGGLIAGSAVVGGLLGWLLRDEAEDQKDEEAYEQKLISDYALDRFIPNISELDYGSIDMDEAYRISEGILKEVELRNAQFESETDEEALIDDLEELQGFIEREAIEAGEYDNVIPIVNSIQDMIGILVQDEIE